MKELEYVITDPVGIHARPAGLLVKMVKESGTKVTITKGDKSVDASKLMMLMGMGIKQGDTVKIAVEDDAKADAVFDFFRENL